MDIKKSRLSKPWPLNINKWSKILSYFKYLNAQINLKTYTLNYNLSTGSLEMSITRIRTTARVSQAVIYNGTVTTAGQVAFDAPGAPINEQTKDTLAQIDKLLAESGTDKSKIISATIWLSSMSDLNAMNDVWDSWVSPGNSPARVCVESKIAAPEYGVEISVIAAVK